MMWNFFQVREVRTTDDTLLTVKLMIFFELKDIIEMVSVGNTELFR